VLRFPNRRCLQAGSPPSPSPNPPRSNDPNPQGITTAIAYQSGFGSTAFACAVAFSSIVMYDAAGVRRHAGKQAEVLNQVIDELLEGHPVSDVKLKEVLGHTPLQVRGPGGARPLARRQGLWALDPAWSFLGHALWAVHAAPAQRSRG
jgi:hypothetical protein